MNYHLRSGLDYLKRRFDKDTPPDKRLLAAYLADGKTAEFMELFKDPQVSWDARTSLMKTIMWAQEFDLFNSCLAIVDALDIPPKEDVLLAYCMLSPEISETFVPRLLSAGRSPNQASSMGLPLHVAVVHHNFQGIHLLVAAGADLLVEDVQGENVLPIAIRTSNAGSRHTIDALASVGLFQLVSPSQVELALEENRASIDLEQHVRHLASLGQALILDADTTSSEIEARRPRL